MEDIINEGKITGAVSPLNIKDTETILAQMKTSICIIDHIAEGKLTGTGFFCNIDLGDQKIPCLLTNYHVLDEKYIREYKKIRISMHDKRINDEITINEKDILYLSPKNEYDLIIIKLNKRENYINYLELDDNLFNKNSELGYINQSIYILHYPNSEKASVSFGNGLLPCNNHKYDIEHKCNTSVYSSGGPILNLSINKVIGIHKGYISKKGLNIGTLLKYPLNSLKNEIRMKIKIGKNDIDKKIYIFNGNNSVLYVDDKIIDSENYFIPEKEGIFSIRLILNDSIKDCSKMFEYRKHLINIDLSSFDTKNVTNMERMFDYCENLESIDLTSFDTKNVTNMERMFSGCSKLKNIDLSSFDTKNVTNMERMFSGCSKLKNIDLSSFDTKNVTNMRNMFSFCVNLKNLDLSSFDTKKVITMMEMFSYCRNLENINLSSFDTKNVKDMNSMFYLCTNLLNIDLSSFNTKNVIDMSWMFANCWSILNINLSSFDFTFCLHPQDMFYDCFHLEKVIIREKFYDRIEYELQFGIEIIKV